MFNDLITLPKFLTAGLGWQAWLLPLILSAILVITGNYDFLIFHIFAEMFAITIAVVLILVVWNTYNYSKNIFLLYLGIGYFWLAVIDLFHTLSYKGMGLFPVDEVNVSLQLWIAARFLQSLLLLSAPLFLTRSVNRERLFVLFGLIATIALMLVFNGYFPTAFIEGSGLTSFKINAEYGIVFILALAAFSLTRKRSLIDFKIYNLMVLTIAFTMVSELAFTFYVSVYGLSNLAGHIFKLLSFWLVYQAIIQTTLKDPFAIMARGVSTYNAIPDPAVVVNVEGIIVQTNRAACEQTGLDESEIINRHFYILFNFGRDKPDADCHICNHVRNGDSVKNHELRVEQSDRWYRYSLTPIETQSAQEGMVLVCSDITSQKMAERAVIENEKLLRTVINTIPDLIWLKDAEGKYLTCNANFEKLYGVDEKELVGKTDYGYVDKEQADFFKLHDKMAMEAGSSVNNEEWLTFASDGHKALFETTKMPMRDSLNNIIGVLGVARDITERFKDKEERERLYNELQQSQKMESLGKLTGGIAHDFNNILGVIVGYSGLLKQSLSDNPELGKFAQQIETAGKRGSNLTKKLLGFSRKKAAHQNTVNLNQVIEENRHMLEKSLTVQIHLKLVLADNLYPVLIDSNDFEDAILNISINAMHAMPNGGELTIESKAIQIENSKSNIFELEDGEYSVVSITDTGSGMTQDEKNRLFEPFFSTKGDNGTGLGMSQVYGFVKRSSGIIHIDSEVDKGTTVTLIFPKYTGLINDSSLETKKEDNLKYSADRVGSESILIVDDEGSLRELAREILEQKGYRVVCAEDGQKALSLLEENKIDLMISDVIMPRMNGYQLSSTVKRKYPAVKIQMVSGFSGFDDDLKHVERDDDLYQNIMRKPVTRDQLLNRVSKIFSNLKSDLSEHHSDDVVQSNSSKLITKKKIEWSEDISVGIDAIDNDHKKLFELLNKSSEENLSSEEVLKLLNELAAYTKYHFEREEKVMEACSYPSLRKHRRVHQYMLQEVTNKIKRYNNGALTQGMLHQFLSDWLVNHIVGMDKTISSYAEGKEELIASVLNH